MITIALQAMPVATRLLASCAAASCLLVSTGVSAQWVNLAATGAVQVRSAGASNENSNLNPGVRNMITWDVPNTQALSPTTNGLGASLAVSGPGRTYAVGSASAELQVIQSPDTMWLGGNLYAGYSMIKEGGTVKSASSLQGQVSFDLTSTSEVQVRGSMGAWQESGPALGFPKTVTTTSPSPNATINVSLIGPNGNLIWQPVTSLTGGQGDVLTLTLAPGHYDLRVAASALANTSSGSTGILGGSVDSYAKFYADVRMIPEPASASLMLLGTCGVWLARRRRQAVALCH